jgi:hypothetical protein
MAEQAAEAPETKSFLDRQRDAALTQVREESAERRRISEIVLGSQERRRRTGEMIRIGSDWVVEVIENGKTSLWTTVVNDRRGIEYHPLVDDALLHLIAQRYDYAGQAIQAHHYARRVLLLPEHGN